MSKLQYEVLQRASLFLQKNKCEPRVAELLLKHHLGLNQTEFIINMRRKVPTNLIKKFEADIKRHAETGVPLQHLTGYEYFYDRKFQVNKDVLIPRPETEELLEKAVDLLNRQSHQDRLSIVDVGTGSGIIGISLALEIPNVQVYATDISEKALKVARANAKKHQAKISFLQGDYLQALIEQGKKVDMIISNPPYIAYEEKGDLSRTVSQYDPEIALFAEGKGLAAYEKIIKQAREVLKANGHILFEIGHSQGERVKALILQGFPRSEVQVIKDMNALDRIVLAKI